MATVDLALTVLGVGGYQFGPYPVGDADTQVTLTVDRTLGVGLNTLDSSTVIAVTISQSPDGGSWTILNTGTVVGGAFGDTSVVTVDLLPGAGRLVRVDIAVSGGPEVAIAGSFVTS